jgi:hypothetical protein
VFKKIMIAAAAFALTALPAVASAAPAGAQAIDGPFVLTVGTPPGRALEVLPGEVSKNGGKIWQWRCWGGLPQQWTRNRV